MFCSAVSWTLSFWDMLFARFLCELKGKRRGLAAALRLFCISVPPQAGAPGIAPGGRRLGAPPVLCAHWVFGFLMLWFSWLGADSVASQRSQRCSWVRWGLPDGHRSRRPAQLSPVRLPWVNGILGVRIRALREQSRDPAAPLPARSAVLPDGVPADGGVL